MRLLLKALLVSIFCPWLAVIIAIIALGIGVVFDYHIPVAAFDVAAFAHLGLTTLLASAWICKIRVLGS